MYIYTYITIWYAILHVYNILEYKHVRTCIYIYIYIHEHVHIHVHIHVYILVHNMNMYMYIYYIPDYEQEGLDGYVLVKDKTKMILEGTCK